MEKGGGERVRGHGRRVEGERALKEAGGKRTRRDVRAQSVVTSHAQTHREGGDEK